MADVDPIYVGCHLCHAEPGQSCRFGLKIGEKYHTRRITAALGPLGVDSIHALAHGRECREDFGGICSVCGQSIARLEKIKPE